MRMEMAHNALRQELVGKKVVTSGGTMLGTLDELVVDTETGEVRYILIRFDSHCPRPEKIDGKGRGVYIFSKMLVGEQKIIVG